ncbi:glycosyltransferase [Rheinheimera texasensis]|uniref:glycosyltransferase n=1 Tax=Rheinheimera texasensis TaxID=306205 RepID=UPI000A00F4E9|nr:glycosyltransferase [Rheinheimera texasensis]
MPEFPLVSVYLPTCNRADLFERALKSVLQQDYPSLEVLVVDDGSENITAEKVQACCKNDPRVRWFRHEQSLGAPVARNLAITKAQGEFITGLDDDDEFLPGRISAFVAAAKEHQSAGFFCSGYRYQLRTGQILSGLKGALIFDLPVLLMKNVVGNQIFIRTELLRAAGGFDPAMPACQDYDMWVRLCIQGLQGYRLPLQNYLVHLDHETPRISTSVKRQQGQMMFVQKHQSLLTPTQRKAQLFYAKLYAGPVSFGQILLECPLTLWPLAVKTTLLRLAGRQV